MAHHRMGVCDSPNSTKNSNYLCQYCRKSANLICFPTSLEEELEIEEIPRIGALMPNINMSRRVPDVLHMVKNCTEFLLDRTYREIHRGRSESTNPKKRKEWIKEQIGTYLNAARKNQSTQPKSLDTAYWEYMKENKNDMGWKKMVGQLQANAIRHKRKIDEEYRWTNMVQCWTSYKNIFELIRDVNICKLEEIKYSINTLKFSLIELKWKFTPWMHILCYHFLFFEMQNVRPILLSCFGPEGHHRILKREFFHSLHSTRRRNTHSGLTDVLCHDNILLSLISRGYYPWKNLNILLGNKIKEPKKGHFLNYIKEKYKINFQFNDNDEENIEEIENINEIASNSDYNPDDTSETED